MVVARALLIGAGYYPDRVLALCRRFSNLEPITAQVRERSSDEAAGQSVPILIGCDELNLGCGVDLCAGSTRLLRPAGRSRRSIYMYPYMQTGGDGCGGSGGGGCGSGCGVLS